MSKKYHLTLGIGLLIAAGFVFAPHSGQTLIVVDAGVQDASFFRDNAAKGSKVFILDADKDGLTQITEILASQSHIANLQIVSHGDAGRLFLGNTMVDADTLTSHTGMMQLWKNALLPSAQIALLGCDVAAGNEGKNFVHTLASLTDADISASSDISGGTATAGNWNLEVHTGAKAPALAFSPSALASYAYTLNHFRYGTMSWSLISGRQVNMKIENVWTNNHGYIPTSKAVGDVVTNAFSLNFGDSQTVSVNLRVTARDAANNEVSTEAVTQSGATWISGIKHTYAANGNYTVYWSDSAREAAGSQQSSTWRSEMKVNIGNGNSSPVAAVPAVVQVLDNAIFRYTMVGIDPNGDSIRFRMGTQQEFYGNSSNSDAPRPTGLQISSTGAIVWDVRNTTLSTPVGARWQMTAMIEDLTSTGAVKSKVPVDFVFVISDKVPATFADVPEETVTPVPGVPTVVDFDVNDPNAGSCVTPAAPVISVLNPPSTDALVWATNQSSTGSATTMTATFTPTEGMAGQSYVVVFRSTTCNGATSERSVTFFVPGENQAPGNIVLSNNSIVEHSAVNSAIGTFTISDIDPGDTHTLTLTGSTNTSIFKLGGGSGRQLQIADAALAASGTYLVTVRATDAGGLFLDKTFTIRLLLDEDEDGIADAVDSFIGNRHYPTAEGLRTELSVRVDSNEGEGTYTGTQATVLRDGSSDLVAFDFNYTANTLHLSDILIKRGERTGRQQYLVVHMGDQLPPGTKKTLYLEDEEYIALCVRDAETTSENDITPSCTGVDEIDFTSCINNADGVTLSGITCTDEGDRYRFDNLTHSGIVGTPPPTADSTPAATTSGGGGGGGSGGGRRTSPVTAYLLSKGLHTAAEQEDALTTCDTKNLFKDVPANAWYAHFVCILKAAGVVSGYKDAQGNELGVYLPANNVTYAELAKMSLLTSGNKPNANGNPKNPSAMNEWSAPYIRTMEGLKISKYPTTLNVKSPATRGDVIAVLLRLLDIPVTKHPSSSFKDLKITHPDADALLTAVDIGALQGDTSTSGELLNTLRPDSPINRAETAKIFYLIMQYSDSH